MRQINPDHVQRLVQSINAAPYFQLLSMKIRELGLGYSIVEIDVSENHLNPFGGVHGGLFSSIIDSAASWALFYGIEDETAGLTSVDLNLSYLSPGIGGKLIAKGSQIKLGRTLGYADCKVTDANEKLYAFGTLTVMILPGKAPILDPPCPGKFLQ
jgi:uncharacterized protein (TIGR00369 family)